MNHNHRVEKGQASTGASQNQRRLKEKMPEGASKFSLQRGSCMILGERQRGALRGGVQSGAFPGPQDALPPPFPIPKEVCEWGSFLTEPPWIRARAPWISARDQVTPFSSVDQPSITGHIIRPARGCHDTQHTLLLLGNLPFRFSLPARLQTTRTIEIECEYKGLKMIWVLFWDRVLGIPGWPPGCWADRWAAPLRAYVTLKIKHRASQASFPPPELHPQPWIIHFDL